MTPLWKNISGRPWWIIFTNRASNNRTLGGIEFEKKKMNYGWTNVVFEESGRKDKVIQFISERND